MEFAFWPAVLAGAAGGLMMTILMTIARAAGATRMDMELLQGSMFTGNRTAARVIGFITHVFMMSGLVLGSLYALVFALLGTDPGDAWWIGAVLGLVHGVIAGVVIAGVVSIHPRMARTGEPARTSGDLRLEPPGLYGRNYGRLTPVGVLMTHVIYGLVVGFVYAALVA